MLCVVNVWCVCGECVVSDVCVVCVVYVYANKQVVNMLVPQLASEGRVLVPLTEVAAMPPWSGYLNGCIALRWMSSPGHFSTLGYTQGVTQT